MTKTKVTATGLRVLKLIAANGGEMNGWAGQRGFSINAAEKLQRDGYLEMLRACKPCQTRWDEEHNIPCERPLVGQKAGNECYARRRLTEAGRAAIA
jgi:hypothetical protein